MTTPDPSALRVGHAERAAAVDALREAADLGRLTPEEAAERIAAAEAAKTRGDLDALLADLTPPPPTFAPYRPSPEQAGQSYVPAPALPSPGASPEDPLVLNALLSDKKRRGAWVLPTYLTVGAMAATVKLDCLEATTAEPLVDLQVNGGLGTVVLVVPEGWGVNVDRLNSGAGTVKSTVSPTPAWGHPQIVVSGSIGLGTFKARHANWWEKRRLQDS